MTTAAEIQPYSPPQFGLSRPAQVSQATTVEQSRAVAEVQAAVVVAQQVPRDINRAIAEMRESCGRLAMAEQAFYAVPNRGEGPSVHLLRELARAWGNIEHGSHELHRDDAAGTSEVQAFAWDKQTNTRTSRTFIAPHERMARGSRQRLTDLGDIQNNNNNVAARAVRECISHVLPRWFVEEAINTCRQTLEHGEGEPLPARIEKMVSWFGAMGVTVEQIEARLDKKRGQWDAGDVAQMKIAGKSIQAGEATKDELFPASPSSTADEIGAPATEQGAKLVSGLPNGTYARGGSRQDIETKVVAAAVAADQAEGNDITTPPADPNGEPQATDETPPQETSDGAGDTPEADTQVEETTASPATGDEITLADQKPKTAMRQSLENRTFQLIGNIKPPLSRADRILVYRDIIGREDINSTNDLTDVEVTKVGDKLYDWRKGAGGEQRLNQKILDIVNTATIAAESQESTQ